MNYRNDRNSHPHEEAQYEASRLSLTLQYQAYLWLSLMTYRMITIALGLKNPLMYSRVSCIYEYFFRISAS